MPCGLARLRINSSTRFCFSASNLLTRSMISFSIAAIAQVSTSCHSWRLDFTPAATCQFKTTVIEVLCRMPQAAALRDVLLRHTTTLGVRRQMVTRYSVERRIETVDTVYGSVRVKVATLADGQIKAAPEHDVSVREVWLAA